MSIAVSTPVGLFERLTQFGLQVLAMVAAAGERGAGAASAGQHAADDRAQAMGPGCCHLALPNNPCPYVGNPANYTCPPGYYRQWWNCPEGTRIRACAECTRDAESCWFGPFYCSIWWWAA